MTIAMSAEYSVIVGYGIAEVWRDPEAGEEWPYLNRPLPTVPEREAIRLQFAVFPNDTWQARADVHQQGESFDDAPAHCITGDAQTPALGLLRQLAEQIYFPSLTGPARATHDAAPPTTISDPTPALDPLVARMAAAGTPVREVRVIEHHHDLASALEDLEDEIADPLESLVAQPWSAYKHQLHRVTVAGGVDGEPVPFNCTSPLCLLDEEVVALVCETWRRAFDLGVSIGGAVAKGGVAVRLPDTELCPICHGYRVAGQSEATTDALACPHCDGEGVVYVTPDVVTLPGATEGLPVQVVRT